MPPSPSDPETLRARHQATGAWLDMGDGDFVAGRTLLAAKGSVHAIESRYPANTASPMDPIAPVDWDDAEVSIGIATSVREAVLCDLADAGYSRL